MTSGVLLMAKSTEIAARYMKELQKGTMHKTYVARVVGCFPEFASSTHTTSLSFTSIDLIGGVLLWVVFRRGEITVDQPIELLQELQGRGFRNRVGPDGKPATTEFRRLLFDEKLGESVVLCKPVTGRTHQIRLHLQWLKHPIVNDPVYNDELYNNKKGWEADEAEQTLLSLPKAALQKDSDTEGAAATTAEKEEEEAKRHPHFDPDCPWCATHWRDPKPSELVMYLHALSYDGPGWHYATPMPDWALGATLDTDQPTTTTSTPEAPTATAEALAEAPTTEASEAGGKAPTHPPDP